MGIKLIVYKSKEPKKLNGKKIKRFYSNKFLEVIGLGDRPQKRKSDGKVYPTFNLKTEKELCWILYKRYGNGRFIVLGRKGRGFFLFWKGTINKEGFLFETSDYFKKNLKWIDKEIEKSEEDEEREDYEKIRDKEKYELTKEKKRYGFGTYLINSGRRGIFHSWDEDKLDLGLKPKKKYSKRKKMEDMSIDELNDF